MEVKMNSIKKYLLVCLISITAAIFIPNVTAVTSNATNTIYLGDSQSSSYSYDYQINSYNINMIVNLNNTMDITENIGAYFNIYKHGIFRKLPIKNKVERLDGTVSNNNVQISNILVSGLSTMYNENGYKVIKIGDPNNTLIGAQNYTIKYLYNIGKDTGKDYDELYFDLIGSDWDTTVDKVSFSIQMPKEFDKAKIGFSSGTKYSTYSNDVTYTVNGNIITGTCNKKLNPGEALTVRIELPEGYFVGASYNFDYLMMGAVGLPIIFAFISILLWSKYGKDDKVIETVEFYPPGEYNSAEVGFLYKGISDKKDVVSLIVYLANKGYLKIVESEDKTSFFKSNGFKFVKLKEYDGNNENERVFLEGLFKSKDEVSSSSLKYKFYTTLEKITTDLNSKENKNTVFEKKSTNKNFIIILMIIATFILITAKPVIENTGSASLIFALIFPGIGFTVLFAGLFGKIPGMPRLFALVWGSGFGGIPWLALVLPAIMADSIYLTTYITGILCIFVMYITLEFMPKRTKNGNEILGKIKGFKRFLEISEKEKLEELVMQDPTYFYNILPYTYVLGISDKWIKKFETIAIPPADWYNDGTNTFNYSSFSTFMSSTMVSATSAMSSNPPSSGGSSGGGHSSGGGSSGGGSGGGGGGSW
jgi:uncharacterized membrane protein YgcG